MPGPETSWQQLKGSWRPTPKIGTFCREPQPTPTMHRLMSAAQCECMVEEQAMLGSERCSMLQEETGQTNRRVCLQARPCPLLQLGTLTCTGECVCKHNRVPTAPDHRQNAHADTRCRCSYVVVCVFMPVHACLSVFMHVCFDAFPRAHSGVRACRCDLDCCELAHFVRAEKETCTSTEQVPGPAVSRSCMHAGPAFPQAASRAALPLTSLRTPPAG